MLVHGPLGFAGRSSNGRYEAEAQRLFAGWLAAGVPANEAERDLYNGLIFYLKQAGLWSQLSCLEVYASHAQAASLFDWTTGLTKATLVGIPTFVAKRSFSTNGVDNAVDTGFNPTLAASNFAQNLNSLGAYFLHDAETAGSSVGWLDTTPDGFTLNPRTTGGTGQSFRSNQASLTSDTSPTPAITTAACFLASNRSGANATQLQRNGVVQAVTTNANQTSAALNNHTLLVGQSSATAFAAIECAIFYAGDSMNAAEHEALYDIFRAFMEVQLATAGSVAKSTPGRTITRGSYTYQGAVRWPPGFTVSDNGDQVVHRIDNATRKIDQSASICSLYPADDHMTPVIDFLPDGRLVAAYTGHGQDGVLRFRRSSSSSPLKFGAEVRAGTLTDLTYVDIHQYGTDLYIRTQEHNAAAPIGGWDLFKSTDAGTTWARKKRLFAGSGLSVDQYYMPCSLESPSDPNTIVAFCNSHPTNVQNRITVLTWNKATGEVRYSAGSAGTIDDGTNDTALCTFSGMASLRTPAAGRSQGSAVSLWNASRIMVRDYVNADGTGSKVSLGKYNSGDITLAANWSFSEIAEFAGEVTSVQFDRRDPTGNSIYAIRNDGVTYDVERWSSADQGATWSLAETVSSSATSAQSLQSPRDAGNDLPVMWARGAYTNFDDQDLTAFW